MTSAEKLHLNGFNMSEVIIIRDGPDEKGHRYVDGRHQISVKHFATVAEAREFVETENTRNGF